MPSFADSIFLFVLALLLFGPKRLPVLARELGKWVGEFRRASNEFKMQMDEELRASEQADRQKQIAAMEAAAPLPPPLDEPEHPHMPRSTHAIAEPSLLSPQAPDSGQTSPAIDNSSAEISGNDDLAGGKTVVFSDTPRENLSAPQGSTSAPRESADGVRPIPIAVSGELRMMPPSTGLPTPRSRNGNGNGNPLGGLLDAIPETAAPATTITEIATAEPAFADAPAESSAHGD